MLLISLLISFSFSFSATADTELCDNVILKEGKLSLTRNERVLVCGSSKAKEGWRDVPVTQAQYQLKIILQEKGRYQPTFERQGDRLLVWAGPLREIKGFEVKGGTGRVDAKHKRKVRGQALTPDKMNEVENWADTGLRSMGYACPEVAVQAQAWDGKVTADLKPGQRQRIATFRKSGLEALDEDALMRYMAFSVGEIYDVRDTQITVSRLLADGLIQSAFFKTECRGDEVDLHLHATVGQPRLFRFGVGASTEEFPFADVWFKNTKLDDRASSFTTSLHGSPREQRLDASAELYLLPWTSRSYFGPRFQLKRESERNYEVNQAKLGADIGRSWDIWKTRLRGRLGPTLNYVDTVDGIGPDATSYLSWEGALLAMSHVYEVFTRDQFEGWNAGIEYRGQRKGVGSEINVDRYEIDFKYLWNLGHFSPPLFVLASRFEFITVDANAIVPGQERRLLPIDDRIFYGGDQNLRGFARKSIDNDQLGYLSAGYAGFELRLIEEVPWRLEPFLLLDLARLGNERNNWDDPVFSSTGVGLRWPSPFGTLRGSAAKGEISNGDESTDAYPQEWVYFVSFGQEF